MTKTVSTAFASVASAFIGRMVAVADATYKIASLSDKIGSLKDGSKGEYVVLQNAADEAVVISLHPQKAKVLFAKGEEGEMVLLDEGVEMTEADKAAVQAEADGAAAPETVVAKVSKKSQFMVIFNAGLAAGKARKEIKADASALSLSDAGFNTYFQNAKSGAWA